MRVKMTVALAALAALTLGLPASAFADKTVNVGPGESIQAAIDAAKPDTTIEVGAGTYHESVLITKDDITLEGAGRKKTKIVPPDNPVEGQGCVFNFGPPSLFVSGVCVSGPDPNSACSNGPEVEDVTISDLTVAGFKDGFGMFAFCAEDTTVTRVIGSNYGAYGIFANSSTGTTIAHTVWGTDDPTLTPEAGIYIGDSPDADATVYKNVTYKNVFGIFIRDAVNGEILKNKTFNNCAGILFLNTDESTNQPPTPQIDVASWVAKRNNSTGNNQSCSGGDEPPVSGIGIGISGGVDIRVIHNNVFGNQPKEGSTSEFSGGIVVAEGSKGTRVGFNTVLGNSTDLFTDGTGEDNQFFANDCLTSQPDGLCTDPIGDDEGDGGDGDGDHGGDRGDGRHGGKSKGGHKQKRAEHSRKHEDHPRVVHDD
jgi:hypothetical protein